MTSAVFVLVSMTWIRGSKRGPEVARTRKSTVVVAAVRPGNEARTARFSGRLEAVRVSRIAFVQAGRVALREVELGDRVAAGQPLFALDREDLERAVAVARTSVERTQAQLEHGASMHRRMLALADADVAPIAELDQAVHDERVARASRKEAQLAFERTTHTLREGILRAPFAGIVTRLEIEVGEYVTPDEIVVEVTDDTALQLEVELPETWIGTVTAGDRVKIDLSLRKEPIEGVIRAVGAATRGRGLYPVVLDVPLAEGLFPGLTAEMVLQADGLPGFVVPVEAVVDRSGSAPGVYVVDEGVVRDVDVDVLDLVGSDAMIQGQLEVDDAVVVRGHVGLFPGKAVDVVP